MNAPGNVLTLALSKGRIFDETVPLLARAGIEIDPQITDSRKLILPVPHANLRLLIVRASDVPTYVQYGAADLGVAGLDVLLEHGQQGLVQPIDLGIGKCRMSVAVAKGFDYAAAIRRGSRLRVATKFTSIAREHFAAKGVHVDVIKLYGSMELAPLMGLADAIVDIVSTGSTLKANDLVEVETIMQVSARLVVNHAALKTRAAELQPLLSSLQSVVQAS
jgi:ATP phosphoribosyltransferase